MLSFVKYTAVLIGLTTLALVARAAQVGGYHMEEGAGTLVGDTSGNANNACFQGTLSWVTGHGGSSQYSLYFDSANYLEAPDSPSLDAISAAFTFAAWLNADSNTTTDSLVWKLGAFHVWKENNNILVTLDGVPNVSTYPIITGYIVNGQWQHVAVTYDGRYLAGYVNGERKRLVRVNDGYVPIATSNYPLRIGWNNSLPYYKGFLDNVRLYDSALSLADIIDDMNTDNVAAPSPLNIVSSAAAQTAIITPDGGFPQVVGYAAGELQYHVAQATGVTVGIYTESAKPGGYAGLIYVGQCQATLAAGIDGACLEDNGYIVRSFTGDLFFAGNDSYGEVTGMLHNNKTRIGTLLAVYDFLANQLAVKWLWPGTSGEIIPPASDLNATSLNTIGQPNIPHKRLRDYAVWAWHGQPSLLGWSNSQARSDFLYDQSVWLRRHGFCQSIDIDYGHSFLSWWDTYSPTHPEYFNLLPDGTRRPDPYYHSGNSTLVDMCMAEPGFRTQIIDNWIGSGASNFINLWMNDTATKDTDPRGMAWDIEPGNFEQQFGHAWADRLAVAATRFNNQELRWYEALGPLSDRYAAFILAVQQEAANRGYPDAVIIGGAYANRAAPPLTTILNDRVILGIVPAHNGFPWLEEWGAASRDVWSGWTQNAHVKAYLRPNYLLQGHNLPVYFADSFAADFLFALRRGMIGTDFDSLTGQYSTQPLNLYTAVRLHGADPDSHLPGDLNGDCRITLDDLAVLADAWLNQIPDCLDILSCPDLDANGLVNARDFAALTANWNQPCGEIEQIFNEFYSCFGPAETAVRNYFAYWELIRKTAASNWTQLWDQAIAQGKAGTPTDPEPWQWHHFLRAADLIFTPPVMAQGRSLLNQATTAAAVDPLAARLVAFLNKGFTNAELTLNAQAAFQAYKDGLGSYAAFTAARNNLDNYRATVENDNVANMAFLAWLEQTEGWNRN